jgi:hypothetical protein
LLGSKGEGEKEGDELVNFRLSHHARQEMERPAIPPDLLQLVRQNPEQIVPEEGKQESVSVAT